MTVRKLIPALSLLCLVLSPFDAAAFQSEPVQAVQSVTATRESLAISYPEGVALGVKLQGTHRLPLATGDAKVERKKGRTEIEVDIDGLKPAIFFGGDFTTYVLWIVSPEGHVDNVGEFILKNGKGKLSGVTTPLETFGMFITAEPHFLVSSPSRFVIAENTRPKQDITDVMIKTSQIRYRGFEGVYNFDRETLTALPKVKGEIREEAEQARVAVSLAERAGAAKYAPQELAKARESLDMTMKAAAAGIAAPQVMLSAHETVRLATDAQKLAEERAFQAALDAERQTHADELAKLEQSKQEAQTEAERARLQAEQRELQLKIVERARQEATKQAEETARRAAEEARLRREAEMRAQQALDEAQRMAAAKSAAESTAERARGEAERLQKEREDARAQMFSALSRVAETRSTARGLIVNLPNILFDFNRATLRPPGREVLSKVTGILLVAKGYALKLEGHTDSIGGDEYNMKLSEKRAEGVRDYLVQSGLPASIITVQGFGKSQPVADNKTAAGREKNRRVEIVIEDAGDQNVSTSR